MRVVHAHKERGVRAPKEPKLKGSQGCCGLDILQDIWDAKPEKVIAYVYRKYFEGDSWHSNKGRPVPFVVFTYSSLQEKGYNHYDQHGQRFKGGYSDKVCNLAGYITENHLGQLSSFTGYNPNSGNNLTAYLWAIDAKGLQEWHNKNDHTRRRSQPARIG